MGQVSGAAIENEDRRFGDKPGICHEGIPPMGGVGQGQASWRSESASVENLPCLADLRQPDVEAGREHR